jgi:hypothetical protein
MQLFNKGKKNMIDIRTIDLAKLNSATAYSSIPTYHVTKIKEEITMWKYYSICRDGESLIPKKDATKENLTLIPLLCYTAVEFGPSFADWHMAPHIAECIVTDKIYDNPEWEDADRFFVELYSEDLSIVRLFYCNIDKDVTSGNARVKVSQPIELIDARRIMDKLLGIAQARRKKARKENKRRLFMAKT